MSESVILLGLAERAAHIREGNTNIFKWSVIGLKHVIASAIYPLPLNGFYIGLVVKISDFQQEREAKIRLVDDANREIFNSSIRLSEDNSKQSDSYLREDGQLMILPDQGWMPMFFLIPKECNAVVWSPGDYRFQVCESGAFKDIGILCFASFDPPALTIEQISAIKSDSNATKAVRAEYSCRKCSSRIRVYAGFEQSKKMEDEEYIWYSSIPDEFRCNCGQITIDLRITKRNFFFLLGQPLAFEEERLNYVPLYETHALESMRASFVNLIDSDPLEEKIQKFIEQNPLLLHQFPATHLFFKPPILTFYDADFAVVTPQKELILIEIEKPNTRLLNKRGDMSSELRHAFDQVQKWLHIIDEHRMAVLDSLKLSRDLVSSVRGVVIAGRDKGYEAEQLRRLKGTERGRVTWMTYDDLAHSLANLKKGLSGL